MTALADPTEITIAGESYVLRPTAMDDVGRIQAFASALPEQDLLYLNRDITKKPVIEAWLKMAASGDLETLLVEKDGVVLATSALMIDKLSWSPHVGEIRVMVAEAARKSGVGRMLIEKTFASAVRRGLKKIIAQMTPDQKGAIRVFEELGFSGEALLKDHVQDADGELHDLVILSCDVEVAHANMAASG